MEMAEFIMTGLRLTEGISFGKFRETFGENIPEDLLRAIEREAARGNLVVQGTAIDLGIVSICRDRLFIADEITFEVVKSLL
jgi:coproporphyrinogen III oxidase-like Fe-S oxidoreductase